jgi:hypothetical protein
MVIVSAVGSVTVAGALLLDDEDLLTSPRHIPARMSYDNQSTRYLARGEILSRRSPWLQ